MQLLWAITLQTLGCALLALATFIWITYQYPDVNPFMPGAAFAPGMFGQVINFFIVVAVAAPGWALFKLGRRARRPRPR